MKNVDDFIDDCAKLFGDEAIDIPVGWIEIDYPALQKFVMALGDENPLFNDANYALTTKYHTLIAPPSFLVGIRAPAARGAFIQKDYGLASLQSQVAFELVDVIRLGDQPSSTLTLTGVAEGQRRTPTGLKRTVDLTCEGAYWNAYGGRLGTTRGTMTFIPYERGKEFLSDRMFHKYSADEIERIESDLQNEQPPRGRTPRYWREDVSVGDALPPLVKGAINLAEMEHWLVAEGRWAWQMGWGNLTYHEVQKTPGLITTNPSTNWPYWNYDQTWEDVQSCELGGFHVPYCRGLMVASLTTQLLTDWMGDDGFLRRFQLDLAVPNLLLYQDTLWINGQVVDKYKEKIGGVVYRAVEVQVQGINQLGETIASGAATVYLPDRGHSVELPIPCE
jgi:acyl dehydratase